jgi:hypothetical protein
MVIERWTWKAKFGCKDEVIKFVKAVVEEAGLTPRVCSYVFGPYEIVTSDLEFETEQDRQEFWDDFDGNKPNITEWHKKQRDLTESEISHDLLHMH